MQGEPPSIEMERSHALDSRNEVWFAFKQVRLIISKCRSSEIEALEAGLPLLLTDVSSSPQDPFVTWTVVCKGKYFGPLSHFSDFC